MAWLGKLSSLGKMGSGTRQASTSASVPFSRTRLARLMGGVAAGGLGLVLALERSLNAGPPELHPPPVPWSHNGIFGQLDTASIRRGWQVYKQVCAACHSLKCVRYYHMINVCMTEAEARAEAAEAVIEDGPDDDGKMFKRPGRLADFIPEPYPNVKAAAAANNGAIPPELSMMVNARHGGEDYVFWLLVGYPEEGAPAGVKLGEGQAYNPYFPGGVIGMPRQLYNEGVEFDDGTVATASQQAKDVSTFLKWTADRHHDQRKQIGFKLMIFTGIFGALTLYMVRTELKTKHLDKFAWRVVPGREPHVGRDHAVPSVFDALPAPTSMTVSAGSQPDGTQIAKTTRHLYKSYSPVHQWKDKTPWAAKYREWQWKTTWDGYKFGLLYEDQNQDEDDDPTVKEAVRRLPPWEKDARHRRILRATILSANNEYLPKSEWTSWEEETWYLQPYLEQLEQEKFDRTWANLGGKPKWLSSHIFNMQLGKGKSMAD